MTHKPPQGIDAGLRDVLSETADQLDRWANESRNGGWSTHQVDPMRRKADELRRALAAAPPDPRKDLAVLVEQPVAEDNWWSAEALDAIRSARMHEPQDSWSDWHSAIKSAVLRAYNRGKDAALAEMRGAKR